MAGRIRMFAKTDLSGRRTTSSQEEKDRTKDGDHNEASGGTKGTIAGALSKPKTKEEWIERGRNLMVKAQDAFHRGGMKGYVIYTQRLDRKK